MSDTLNRRAAQSTILGFLYCLLDPSGWVQVGLAAALGAVVAWWRDLTPVDTSLLIVITVILGFLFGYFRTSAKRRTAKIEEHVQFDVLSANVVVSAPDDGVISIGLRYISSLPRPLTYLGLIPHAIEVGSRRVPVENAKVVSARTLNSVDKIIISIPLDAKQVRAIRSAVPVQLLEQQPDLVFAQEFRLFGSLRFQDFDREHTVEFDRTVQNATIKFARGATQRRRLGANDKRSVRGE